MTQETVEGSRLVHSREYLNKILNYLTSPVLKDFTKRVDHCRSNLDDCLDLCESHHPGIRETWQSNVLQNEHSQFTRLLELHFGVEKVSVKEKFNKSGSKREIQTTESNLCALQEANREENMRKQEFETHSSICGHWTLAHTA